MKAESSMKLHPSGRSSKLGLSGIRQIFEKAQKIPDIVRLEFGEPDFDTPENIKLAAIQAIKNGKTKYTSSSGLLELREQIALKLKRENKIEYDPKTEVVVTAGATAAINLAFLSVVDEGQEILVPDPGWATYSHAVNLVGAIPVSYGLREAKGYSFDREEAEKLVSSKTRAILINTPSNPTGSIFSRNNLEEIAEFAMDHELFVFSDEVYEKFLYQDGGNSTNEHVSIGSLEGMKERTVTINAFSKTYAMTGWRMGYAAAPPEISATISKINAAQSSCVSTIAQYAAIEALSGPQDSVKTMISAFAKRRELLVTGLNQFPGFRSLMPKGAFYAFPNIEQTGFTSFDLAMKIIDEAHVAVVPGSAFGKLGEGYLRLAYANSMENIQEGLNRIQKILK
ncbi:MAG: pyridoxal phosphate-dependent aminotransferase [Thaumarchaeota archaeon]|nr:pyridoxal phosphate-dependent aminotransferase [Nitrososphaerota archaeon]